MGKHGKLRCFFGLRRSRSSSDEKLSLPSLLQKCPAPPNQYFNSGRDQEDLATVDGKGKKMEVIESGDPVKSLKRKEEMAAIEEEEIISLRETMNRCSNNGTRYDHKERNIDLAVTADKQARLGVDAKLQSDGGNTIAQYQSKTGTSAVVNLPQSSSSSIKMNQRCFIRDQAMASNNSIKERAYDFVPSVNELASNPDPGKIIRKEFPASKRNKNKFPSESKEEPHSSGSCSAEWNTSGACKVTASSFRCSPSSSSSIDCSCGTCSAAKGLVRDCDWGWFTDTPKSSSLDHEASYYNDEATSQESDQQFHLHTYVNDTTPRETFNLNQTASSSFNKDAFVYSHSSDPRSRRNANEEVAFTITEKTGRSIQVTITTPEPKSHCSSARSESRRNFGNSRLHAPSSGNRNKFLFEEATARADISEKLGFDTYPYSLNGACNSRADCSKHSIQKREPMAPSLGTQEKEMKNTMPNFPQKRMPKEAECREQRKDVQRTSTHLLPEKAAQNHRGKAHKGGRSPNIELSMASYSKLMNYCQTNKLILTAKKRDENDSISNTSAHRSGSSQQSRDPSFSLHGTHVSSTSKSPAAPHRSQEQVPYGSPNSPTVVNDLCRLAKVLQTVEECAWYWGPMTGGDSRNELRNSPNGTFLLRDSSDPRYLFSLSVKTRQGPTSIRIVYTDGAFRFDSEMDDASTRRQQQQGASRHGATSRQHGDHPNYVKRLTPVFTCVINMILFYSNHLGLALPKSRSPKNPASSDRVGSERCLASSQDTTSKNNSTEERPGSAPTGSSPEQFMCYWMNRNGRQEIPIMLSKPKTRSFPSLQRLCRQTLSSSQKLWVHEQKIEQLPLPNKLKKYIKKYPYPI